MSGTTFTTPCELPPFTKSCCAVSGSGAMRLNSPAKVAGFAWFCAGAHWAGVGRPTGR